MYVYEELSQSYVDWKIKESDTRNSNMKLNGLC